VARTKVVKIKAVKVRVVKTKVVKTKGIKIRDLKLLKHLRPLIKTELTRPLTPLKEVKVVQGNLELVVLKTVLKI
jgi:hypothetical protein